MTTDSIELPPLPPQDGPDVGVYTGDAMRSYALLAIQQERERCARVCETLNHGAFGDASFLRGVEAGSIGCRNAIRKG